MNDEQCPWQMEHLMCHRPGTSFIVHGPCDIYISGTDFVTLGGESMRKFILLYVIFTATILHAQPSPPPDPSKIQVLIITGQNVHDWRGTTPILKQILEDTKKFEVRVVEEFRGAGPETLANYDLVVVNYRSEERR